VVELILELKELEKRSEEAKQQSEEAIQVSKDVEIDMECKIDKLEFKLKEANEKKSLNEKQLEELRSELVQTKDEKEEIITSLTKVIERTKVEVVKTISQNKDLKSQVEIKDKRIEELSKQSAANSSASLSGRQANDKSKPKHLGDQKPLSVKREKNEDEQASKSKKAKIDGTPKLEGGEKPQSAKKEKFSEEYKKQASGSKKIKSEGNSKQEDNIETKKNQLIEQYKGIIKKIDTGKNCKEVEVCPAMRMNCTACKEYTMKKLTNFERKNAKLVIEQYPELDLKIICQIFRETLLKQCLFKPDK